MLGCSYTHKYVMSHRDKFAIIRTFGISAIYLFTNGRKGRGVPVTTEGLSARALATYYTEHSVSEPRSCGCRSRVAGCPRATVGWKCLFRLTRELYQHPTWLVLTRCNKLRGILQYILMTIPIYIEANSTV